jgi:hypothetical protein
MMGIGIYGEFEVASAIEWAWRFSVERALLRRCLIHRNWELRLCEVKAIFCREGSIALETFIGASACPCGLPVGQVGLLCSVSGD